MIELRELRPAELSAAIEKVVEVFSEFVRPDLTEGGWTKLLEYLDTGAAIARAGDHVTIGAFDGGALVGVLEIRRTTHISLLVVDKRNFGRGVARRLLTEACERCHQADASIEQLTVNASRYAIEAYRRLGFLETAEEMVVDGIRFTPMALSLPR